MKPYLSSSVGRGVDGDLREGGREKGREGGREGERGRERERKLKCEKDSVRCLIIIIVFVL